MAHTGSYLVTRPDYYTSLESRLSFNPFEKKEVSDKDNANNISKAIALSQTIWFIIQCVFRKIYVLPLTLVEVHVCIQIIYAALMTLFWWKKPFDVNNPTVITVDKDLWNYIVGTGKEDRDQSEKLDKSALIVPNPESRRKMDSDQGEKQDNPVFIVRNPESCDFNPTEGFHRTEYSLSTIYSKNMLVVIEPTRLTGYKLLYHTWHSVMSQLGEREGRTKVVRNRFPMQ